MATATRQASRRLSQFYDRVLAPSGLRNTQYVILTELDRRSGNAPTVKELAAVLVLERSALGQALRPLERDGLVEFAADSGDARQRFVQLTSSGAEALRNAWPYWQDAQARVFEAIGDDPAVQLRAALHQIAHDTRLS